MAPRKQLKKGKRGCIFLLSPPKKEGHPNGCKFTIHPACQIQILQLPKYEFHIIMIFVDILQLHSSDIGTSKLSILQYSAVRSFLSRIVKGLEGYWSV